MRLKRILVPTDFSPISLSAFDDAVKLALQADIELYHLHVVDSQKLVERGRMQLQAISDKVHEEHKLKVKNLVRVGEFMKSIGDLTYEIDADLVIMGTHGLKGMQWLTGSNAMKILSKSRAPILISQKSSNKALQHIVVPLDYRVETRQKLDMAIKIAAAYKARIHLLVQRELDSLLVEKMNKMIKQVTAYILDHKVEYTLNYEDKAISSNRLLDFAHRVGADLIAIINYQEEVYTELFGVSREQGLITNKYNIPVLCVNAKQTSNIVTSY